MNLPPEDLIISGEQMNYRKLGKTGLKVSEVGLGGEWLERHSAEEVKAVVEQCESLGINILDCWMSEPNVRSNIGAAIKNHRKKWIVQGHIGSTWQNGQYVRSRDLEKAVPAFEDLLARFQTDYVDLGMIHFVDSPDEFDRLQDSDFIRYIKELKAKGTVRHIGLSTHNPFVGQLAAKSGYIEMIMFSVNPAFDMMPGSDNLDDLFGEETYNNALNGVAPERAELYRLCEANEIGITVMKGYAGGRLFNEKASPFGAALTPVQCLHYALTRPAVASVMVGFDTPEHVKAACAYETATADEKDYAKVLASAPKHAYSKGQCTYCGHCAPCPSGIDIAMVNKFYDLAVMQNETPATLKAHYSELSAHGGDCIGCGGCESRCPFGVNIIQKMAAAKELFGV